MLYNVGLANNIDTSFLDYLFSCLFFNPKSPLACTLTVLLFSNCDRFIVCIALIFYPITKRIILTYIFSITLFYWFGW